MDSYRKRTEGLVTNTKIEDFIYCQYLYKLKWIDGVETEEDLDGDIEDPDWAVIGTAYDVYMQSVQKFNDEYEIVPKKTNKSSKIELTMTQGKLIRRMAAEMMRQDFYNSTGVKQYAVKYKYNEHITLSGTLDEFQEQNRVIIDDKTTANIRKFRDKQQRYKSQLAFYQFLIYMTLGILCDGMIRAVTKEKISKSQFFFCDAKNLENEWQRMKDALDLLTECIKTGVFEPQPRDKCMDCPAYAHCPNAIQTELYLL